MTWGTVHLEPQVERWLEDLPTANFARTVFYIEMLAEQGPQLGEPCTRQVDEKTRELRFHLDKQAIRITYVIVTDRRIILLTGVSHEAQPRRAGGRSSTPGAEAVYRRGALRSGGWLGHE